MTAFEVKYRPVIVYADTFADLAAIPADLTLTKHAFILDNGDEYVLEPKSTVWQKLTDAEAEAIAELEAELDANRIYNTASSAAVCSFSDGADNIPMKSLIAEITPVQDLHGQANPYPAGGGANKFNPAEAQNHKWIDNSTGEIVDNSGDYWVTGFIPVKSGDVVRATAKGSARNAWFDTNKSNPTYVGFSGGEATATAPADGYIVMTVAGATIAYGGDFMVTINNADTTFAPYSNICPISGWDGVTVTHTDGDDYSKTYDITFHTPPGTVYGGTLDVISGVLTVTHGIMTINSAPSDTWTETTAGGHDAYYFEPSDMSRGAAQVGYADWLKTISSTVNTGIVFGTGASSRRVYCCGMNDLLGVSNLSEFSAYLAEHPLTIVYPLAEPAVYQLDPVTVTTLLKQNTIFADTGNTSATYCADPKTYIDNAIASAVAALS